MRSKAAAFFTKNGKKLRAITKKKERVTTIYKAVQTQASRIYKHETISSITKPKNPYLKKLNKYFDWDKFFVKAEPVLTNIQKHTKKTYRLSRQWAVTIGTAIAKQDFAKTWVIGSIAAFFIFASFVVFFPTKITPKLEEYSIYSSRPLVLDSNTNEIYTKDSRAQRINEVFRLYDCPMEGLGEIFVAEADKNNIPWWLVASIAFQESSCGKNMPDLEGQSSFNSWGWGVYGDNVHMFDNWVRGIETVSKYMGENFFAEGVTEPCEIMKTYTPPSEGSWCKGVEFFGEQIVNYKTPIEDSEVVDSTE